MLKTAVVALLILLLSACSGGSGPTNSGAGTGQTNVTVALGQSVATGAVAASGVIPANVLSATVAAFDATGLLLAGPAIANQPNMVVTLIVPNAIGVVFVVRAFSGAGGTGVLLHEGKSVADLNGAPLTLSVTMNLSVVATAATTQVLRNQAVTLTGTVLGATPPATSPLLWSATGGAVASTGANGATAQWTAPNLPGSYTITAKINPALNPNQDPNFAGTVVLVVTNQNPAISAPVTRFDAVEQAVTTHQLSATDPENDPLTFSLAAGGPAWATINAAGLLTLTPPAGSAGTYNLTAVVTDPYGGRAQLALPVSVIFVDTLPPVITPPANLTLSATSAAGTAVSDPYISGFLNSVTVVDNVAVVGGIGNNAPTIFPFGTTVVTFTASDAAGNRGTASASVVVTDLTPPTIIAPANLTIEATGPTTAVTLGNTTVTDNVSTGLTATATPTGPFAVGSYSILWSATDGYGNTGTARQTLIVRDTTPPAITAPADLYVEASGLRTKPASLGLATASDLVAGIVAVTNNAPAAGFLLGTTVVSWTASDGYGNTASKTQRVIVRDTTAPTVTAPADLYVEASGLLTPVALGNATATDLVSGTLATSNNAPANGYPIGTTQVLWVAIDGYGNVGSRVQQVVVTDTTAPTLTLPADIYVEATGPLTMVTIGSATATDLVTGQVQTFNNAPTAGFPVGTTQVIWEAFDGYGNISSGTQNIVVRDTTAPTLTIPADIYVQAVGPLTAVTLGAAAASDLVSGNITATNDAPAGFPVGITAVTWSASDSYGNTTSKIQQIIVQDNTPPVLTAPVDVYIEATGVFTALSFGSAVAVDAVAGNLLPANNAPTAGFPVGSTAVIWSATDPYGNSSSAVQYVVVTDKTAPVFTPPADVYASATSLYTPVTLTLPTVFDLVSGAIMPTSNQPTGYPVGTTIVIWTAVDNYGNQTTVQQQVIVTDTTAPVVTPPAPLTIIGVDLNGTPRSYPAIKAYLQLATATDAVMGATVVTHNAPAQLPVGTTTITFSTTDSYGNSSSATSTVTVTAPPTGRVTFTIHDIYGAVLPGTQVGVYDAYTNSRIFVGLTDTYGMVASNLDPAGGYFVGIDVKQFPYSSGFWTGYTTLGKANISERRSSDKPALLEFSTVANPVIDLYTVLGGLISGTVTDSYGVPVPFAKVSYFFDEPYIMQNGGFFTYADQSGYYITGLQGGQHRIFADALYLDSYGQDTILPGGQMGGFADGFGAVTPFMNLSLSFPVNVPSNSLVNIKLQQGATLSGLIQDQFALPVANVNLLVTPFGTAATTLHLMTSASGSYALNLWSGIQYLILVSGTQYDTLSQSESPLPGNLLGGFADIYGSVSSLFTQAKIILPAASTTTLANIMLPQGGTITGTVSDAYGAPLPFVRVLVRDIYAQSVNFLTASVSGHYAINVPAGSYRVAVDSYSYDATTNSFVPLPNGLTGGYVDPNGGVVVDLYAAGLFPTAIGSTVTVNARLSAGLPFNINGAVAVGAAKPNVFIRAVDIFGHEAVARSDKNGRYTISANLVPPLLLKVAQEKSAPTLYSLASQQGNAHVTTLTTLATELAFSGSRQMRVANLGEQRMASSLQQVRSALGLSSFALLGQSNFITDARFAANGEGLDAVMDALDLVQRDLDGDKRSDLLFTPRNNGSKGAAVAIFNRKTGQLVSGPLSYELRGSALPGERLANREIGKDDLLRISVQGVTTKRATNNK